MARAAEAASPHSVPGTEPRPTIAGASTTPRTVKTNTRECQCWRQQAVALSLSFSVFCAQASPRRSCSRRQPRVPRSRASRAAPSPQGLRSKAKA
eukprot:13493563-Heterocapsa_arctica.AAC.1